jgi:uncharacterized lipoprotein YbaY
MEGSRFGAVTVILPAPTESSLNKECPMRPVHLCRSGLAVALVAAFTTVAGCANHKRPDPMNAVSGTITFPHQAALGPNAVAYVRLADLSDDLVGGKTVVQNAVHVDADGSIPLNLAYREKSIKPNHQYAVDVRVVDHGQLVLLSDGKNPVITNGHGNTLDLALQTPGRH